MNVGYSFSAALFQFSIRIQKVFAICVLFNTFSWPTLRNERFDCTRLEVGRNTCLKVWISRCRAVTFKGALTLRNWCTIIRWRSRTLNYFTSKLSVHKTPCASVGFPFTYMHILVSFSSPCQQPSTAIIKLYNGWEEERSQDPKQHITSPWRRCRWCWWRHQVPSYDRSRRRSPSHSMPCLVSTDWWGLPLTAIDKKMGKERNVRSSVTPKDFCFFSSLKLGFYSRVGPAAGDGISEQLIHLNLILILFLSKITRLSFSPKMGATIMQNVTRTRQRLRGVFLCAPQLIRIIEGDIFKINWMK